MSVRPASRLEDGDDEQIESGLEATRRSGSLVFSAHTRG